MKMKKAYLLLVMTVDGAVCRDDGLEECACADIHDHTAYSTRKQAEEVRDHEIACDLETEEEEYGADENAYEHTIEDCGDDKVLTIYVNGDLLVQITYKIIEMSVKGE